MKVVFDLDDTICVHKKRDFKNAVPVSATIDKMNTLKNMGCSISIYTARGQNSCKGDLVRIKEKYEKDIIEWLNQNNVPFDELIFGKPLGDLYVDDKGVSLDDFLKMDFKLLKGNSGSEIYKSGNIVFKKCENPWEQYAWYEQAQGYGVNVPKVFSVVLDTITMEYIDGKIDELTLPLLYKILSNVFLFKQIQDGSSFDIEALIERVNEHLRDKEVEHPFQKTKSYLNANKGFLSRSASFSHGDMSLSNCLLKNGNVYLIDPNQKKNYSSYLLDLAKLKFSMNGGEQFLNNSEPLNTKSVHAQYVVFLSNANLLEIVTALEITHWLRLLKYEKDGEKVGLIVSKAIQLEETLW